MFERTRDLLGYGLELLAQRVSVPQRFPSASRVFVPGRTLAGVRITPDNATTLSAVWACTRYITQSVAVGPWHVFVKGDKGPEIQESHPVDWLLYKQPNPEMTSFQFRETLAHWALLWGNGYGEIEVDSVGRPVSLWPLEPWRVEVKRDSSGKLYYEVDNQGLKENSILRPERMYHIRGFGHGAKGVSVVDVAAESLGWAKAAQLFGSAFFGNGMTTSGVVAHKKALKPGGLKRQKKEFEDLHKGPYKAWGVAHIDNDAEWKSMSVTPEQGQFITTNQHLVEEVCRWFGVPPHKIMHLLRATFSNIEHQAIEVVVDSVGPWVKRFEDEADIKLFGRNRSNLYTKVNMRALLRGDMAARVQYYQGMQQMGAYSINRILELEDENTLGAEGDLHVMQAQWRTLDQIANPVEPPTPQSQPSGTRAQVQDDVDDEEAELIISSMEDKVHV